MNFLFSLSLHFHTHAGAAAYPYWGQAMTYYVPQAMQAQGSTVAANSTSNVVNSNNNNDSNGNKAHIQSPHSVQPHPNTVVVAAKTPLYASNSTNETKSITTPNAASQPNVFQYPPSMTSTVPSTSSTSSITNNATTTNATNHSVALTSVQSLPNTSVSSSSTSLPPTTTNIVNENPKPVSHIPNAGHPSHR